MSSFNDPVEITGAYREQKNLCNHNIDSFPKSPASWEIAKRSAASFSVVLVSSLSLSHSNSETSTKFYKHKLWCIRININHQLGISYVTNKIQRKRFLACCLLPSEENWQASIPTQLITSLLSFWNKREKGHKKNKTGKTHLYNLTKLLGKTKRNLLLKAPLSKNDI